MKRMVSTLPLSTHPSRKDANGFPPPVVKLGSPGKPVVFGSERCAARDTLPAETVVVVALIHPADFEGVLALDPGQIVIKRVDGIFRSVVGRAAPGGVAFAEAESRRRFSSQSGTPARQTLSFQLMPLLTVACGGS